MAQFTYKARKRSGEVVTGMLEVTDRGAALMQIERLGLFPIAVEMPKGAAIALAASQKPAGQRVTWAEMMPPSVRQYMNRQRKPKLRELSTFTNQLANLIKAGMPLTTALNSMSHLETKGIPMEVSRQLKQDVMEGKGLSEAMGKQPVIFSDLFVNMVKAGEQSGALEQVLRRMGDHYERFSQVQQKVKSAMIYPIFLVSVGIGISIFFMTVMLPAFMSLFKDMNVQLPLATRILIGMNDFVKTWWLAGIAVVVVTGIVFARFRTTENGKLTIDRWKINMPIVGKVVRLHLFGQFARTLATLLQNGVPVLKALEITEQIIDNRILKQAIAKTRQEVTDGKTISQPLARSKVFPQLMVDLIKIGEETGDIPGSLTNLAETYELELTIGLQVMMSMIQPIILCVMALMVGFLLLAIFSAMFSITASIHA
jgi:type II secretory pathway component PulF